MELLKSDYFIENIIESTPDKLDLTKTIIWIWHADKVPPHVGISSKGKYFSLKATGKDENIDAFRVCQLLGKKTLVTLCVELNVALELQGLVEAFDSLKHTIPGEITCLAPINDALNLNSPKLILLLQSLFDQNKISNVFGFNVPAGYQGIKNYHVSDIHDRLQKLEDAK